jgi:hypothetical protein
MTRKRSSLEVDRLYVDIDGNYFFTPDGIGVVWFEDEHEAVEQTGGFDGYVIQLHDDLED